METGSTIIGKMDGTEIGTENKVGGIIGDVGDGNVTISGVSAIGL